MNDKYIAKEIGELRQEIDFSCAIRVQATNGEVLYSYNDKKDFLSASLIKILIARYALEIEKKDATYLDQTLIVDPNQIVGGAGIIRGLRNKKWKISDLIYLMLNVSDNTATNTLIKYFGLNNLKNWVDKNYIDLQLGRYMMLPSQHENIINLAEFLKPWTELFEGDSELSQVIKDAMRHSLNKNKLPALLPESSFDGHTYNKTGELAHEEHDITRFKNESSFVDCAVLTHFDTEAQRIESIHFIQKVGLVIANAFIV